MDKFASILEFGMATNKYTAEGWSIHCMGVNITPHEDDHYTTWGMMIRLHGGDRYMAWGLGWLSHTCSFVKVLYHASVKWWHHVIYAAYKDKEWFLIRLPFDHEKRSVLRTNSLLTMRMEKVQVGYSIMSRYTIRPTRRGIKTGDLFLVQC